MQGVVISPSYGIYLSEKRFNSSLGTYVKHYRGVNRVVGLMLFYESLNESITAIDALKDKFLADGGWTATKTTFEGKYTWNITRSDYDLPVIRLSAAKDPDYFMARDAAGSAGYTNKYWTSVELTMTSY